MLPAISLLGTFLSFLRGPVFGVIDKLVADADLKERLKAELEQRAIDHESEVAKARRDVVIAEIAAESWMTRHWRPCLMFTIIGFLVLYGVILPLADLIAGRPVAFAPRWGDVPEGMWTLLTLGVGGYVGGRSLEKLAAAWAGRTGEAPPRPTGSRQLGGDRR
jgi:hypothetical protein